MREHKQNYVENHFLIWKGISPLSVVPVGSVRRVCIARTPQGFSPAPFCCSAFKCCLDSCLSTQTSTCHIYFLVIQVFIFHKLSVPRGPYSQLPFSPHLPMPALIESAAFTAVSKDQFPAVTLSQASCRVSASLLIASICLSLPRVARV